MNKVIYIIIINEYDKRISKPFKKIHIFIREVYLPWRIGGVNIPDHKKDCLKKQKVFWYNNTKHFIEVHTLHKINN